MLRYSILRRFSLVSSAEWYLSTNLPPVNGTAHRPGLDRRHPHRVGPVDDDVGVGRRVVVGVAAVAVVDEPAAALDAQAVGGLDRVRAVGRVDRDAEVLVGSSSAAARCPAGAASPSAAVKHDQPKPSIAPVSNTTCRTGRDLQPQAHRGPGSPSASICSFNSVRSTRSSAPRASINTMSSTVVRLGRSPRTRGSGARRTRCRASGRAPSGPSGP